MVNFLQIYEVHKLLMIVIIHWFFFKMELRGFSNLIVLLWCSDVPPYLGLDRMTMFNQISKLFIIWRRLLIRYVCWKHNYTKNAFSCLWILLEISIVLVATGCSLPSRCCIFDGWLCEERYCISIMVFSQSIREG